MKFIITIFLATLFNVECYSQQLDQNISEIANDLAQKVSKKSRVKLALTDFVNSEGKIDALTSYIRDELELKLINSDYDLQVIDRKHIQLLLSEHHLQSEGLIDETTAKSAISFIKIDGWLLAEITTLGDQIKIKVTVTDVSTSQIYAASTSGLISDIAIKNLLEPEIKVCTECGGKGVVQIQTTCTSCEGNGSYKCSDCKGTGRRPGMTVGSYIKCETCNGVGKIECKICSGNGKIISYKTCPKCNGKVQLPTSSTQINQTKMEFCSDCAGTGKIKVQTTCAKCSGSGQVPFGPTSNWEIKPCQYCSGKGQIISYKTCPKCNGTGKL
jgi:RecJ-like exonuclease